jgi:hypothetical protein
MTKNSSVLAAAMLVAGAMGAQAQTGVKYGARDPQKCASTKEPTKGAISAELAKKYVACHIEKELSGSLYLVEIAKVEVGKGTPFMELPGGSRPFEADHEGLVYQIRGSMQRYACSAVSDFMRNAGKNCDVENEEKATGTCFRNGFGDWICNLIEHGAQRLTKQPTPAKH